MRSLALLTRMAPWALATGFAVLHDRLLSRRSDALLSADELELRLDRVERTLGWVEIGRTGTLWAGAPPAMRAAALLYRGPAETTTGDFVFRAVRLPNSAEYEVAVDPRAHDPLTSAVLRGDPWFLDDYAVLLDLVEPGCAVLDLGAHVGTFALAAATLGAEVICVEAAPDNLRLLRASIERNERARAGREMHGPVRVVAAAVGDRVEEVQFLPHGPWGTLLNTSARGDPSLVHASALEPVTVPMLTVDRLLEDLGGPVVHLVKLDVEGSELAAISGMAGLLSEPNAPVLLYESNAHALSLFGNTTAELESALRDFGYRSYVVEFPRLVPTELKRLRVNCVVNCLAVKGELPARLRDRVATESTLGDTVREIVAASRSPYTHDRRYLAESLACAEIALLREPRVARALRLLAEDPDAGVRAPLAPLSTTLAERKRT